MKVTGGRGSATAWGVFDLVLAVACVLGAALAHLRILWLIAAGFVVVAGRQLELARRLKDQD